MKKWFWVLLLLTGCSSWEKVEIYEVHHCYNGYCTAVMEHPSGTTFIKTLENPQVGDKVKLKCVEGCK